MRLWHPALIKHLPRMQLLGQHREIAAMRGRGWGKKHSTVYYVWKYPFEYLVKYHHLVIIEMQRRGYKPDEKWSAYAYRGKRLPERPDWAQDHKVLTCFTYTPIEYTEHNNEYLRECLHNLLTKMWADLNGENKKYSEEEHLSIREFVVKNILPIGVEYKQWIKKFLQNP